MIRTPAVAGQFYAASSARLVQQVEQYVVVNQSKADAVGIMVPHAGLLYSGAVAGMVYSSIVMPKTFIMLGPNHTGIGSPVSLMDDGEWEVPNGRARIDRKLAARILRNSPTAARDTQAHAFEHSLEVQIPFIVHFSPDLSIVPIALMTISYEQCRELAEGIVQAVRSVDYSVTVLASSDMSHYISDAAARQKDKLAVDRILAMDPPGLYAVVRKERISMCGVLPATVMLIAAQMLGARHATLIKYMTSGEVSGDYDAVVGYAGIALTK